jgi:hypothetical protein
MAVGVTRDSYGRAEQLAHDLLRIRTARSLGLENRQGSGKVNLYMTLPGRERDHVLPHWFVGYGTSILVLQRRPRLRSGPPA